jgi:hypothetical protein
MDIALRAADIYALELKEESLGNIIVSSAG